MGGGLTGYSSDLKRPDFPILNSLFQFDDAGVEQMSYNEWKKANDIKLHCIALVRAGQLTRLLQHMQLLPPNSPVRQQRFLDFFWAELPKNSESPIKWFKSYIKSLYSIEKQLTRDESIQVAKYTCAYNGFKLTLIERGIQLRLVQCTHELGNIFYSAGSLNLAHLIFDVGQVIDGLIDCTLAIGRYKVAAVFVADFYPPQMFESFLKIARNKHPVKNLHSFIEYFLQLIQQVRFDSWNRDQILFLANRYL